MGVITSKKAWDTLQEEFQGNEKIRVVKLQYLRRDFKNIKMKEHKIAKDYYSRKVNQLRAYSKNISKKKLVEKILISCIE